jgi:hypothetical protein
MRHIVCSIVLLCGILLGGCSESGETQIVTSQSIDTSELQGVWITDAAALDKFEAFAALPKADQGMTRSLHKNMFAGTTLTITSDKLSAGNPSKGHQETVYDYQGYLAAG